MLNYTFLVEIGVEELPSKILKKLGCDFSNRISDELKKNNVHCSEMHWFASPRHLAVKSNVWMNDEYCVCDNQLDNRNDVRDNISNIVNINNYQNEILVTENVKKKYEFIKNLDINKNTQDLFYRIVAIALTGLINYKTMRWGDITIPFIRPIHTVTILLDSYLIKGCFFGVNTDRVLHGHQFMEHNEVMINHADDYPEILLKKGKVIVDYKKRKEIIYLGIKEEAQKVGGFVNIKDDDLIDEVTSLVEWPVVLSGKFDKKFLSLPDEIILHIMKHDQKYFPVYNPDNGTLLPFFIFVANIITNNYKRVVIGYENVIKPRLMDAEFFFKKDDQYRLEDYMCKLDAVLFHNKLGTLREKSNRIASLSGWIAASIGEDVQQAKRAGYLCKCDLASSMVFEFPLTQGVIGMHYARRDGELEKVALAQKEHYRPKFSTDILPTTYLSCIVSIADKIDTISGIFGIKEFPRGNRDPFSLKRFAFGILRILIQKRISLNLFDLIEESVRLYGLKLINKSVIKDIHVFMYKRLYSWYCMKNFKLNVIKAVLAVNFFDVLDVDVRMNAIDVFLSLHKEESIKLCVIYKRIVNIISNKLIFFDEDLQKFLLKQSEEIQLVNRMILVEEKIQFFLKNRDYYEVLMLLVTLFDPINEFFDKVIVLDENKMLQRNRLILLNNVKNLFLRIMDVSLLYN